MIRAARLFLVPLAVAALLAGPAGAETATSACVDPLTNQLVLTQEQTYLHQAETKAGNIAALGAGSFPSWNTTAPAASVRGGAGGGYAGNSASYLAPEVAEQTGLTVQGAFNGCLDTMLVNLYAAMPTNRTGTSGSLAESSLTAVVHLTIDGQKVVDGVEVKTHSVPNPTGQATYLQRFSIVGLHAAMQDFALDPAANHTIRFTVAPRYLNTDNAVFVYDTTEVPAGFLFNGTPDENYPQVAAF